VLLASIVSQVREVCGRGHCCESGLISECSAGRKSAAGEARAEVAIRQADGWHDGFVILGDDAALALLEFSDDAALMVVAALAK